MKGSEVTKHLTIDLRTNLKSGPSWNNTFTRWTNQTSATKQISKWSQTPVESISNELWQNDESFCEMQMKNGKTIPNKRSPIYKRIIGPNTISSILNDCLRSLIRIMNVNRYRRSEPGLIVERGRKRRKWTFCRNSRRDRIRSRVCYWKFSKIVIYKKRLND